MKVTTIGGFVMAGIRCSLRKAKGRKNNDKLGIKNDTQLKLLASRFL